MIDKNCLPRLLAAMWLGFQVAWFLIGKGSSQKRWLGNTASTVIIMSWLKTPAVDYLS
jgi:hypothetical protein